MKNLLILTSVLAVAACGGGSGGGAPGVLSVEDSNLRVTGMNSFVVVGGENPTVNPNARIAITSGRDGIRYDLGNVTLKTIPTSGVISALVFHVNENGKIESIEFPEAESIMATHLGSEVAVGPIERDGDTNMFIYHDVNGGLAGQSADIPWEYISYAKQLGLKYSDFGVLKTDMASTEISGFQDMEPFLTPFAGGYDVKNINTADMNTLAQNGDVSFMGLAKGQLSYHDWNNDSEVLLAGGLTDENATLTFAQDGSQTLAANFSNWAQIHVIKASDETGQLIIDNIYVNENSPYYSETTPQGLTGDMGGEHSMVFETGYYGDNGLPSEAVGLVQYQRQFGGYHWVEANEGDDGVVWNPDLNQWGFWDRENHLNLDLGFGGTIQ